MSRLGSGLVLGVCLLAGASTAGAEEVHPGQVPDLKPNILVIVADDLGVDRVGAYAEHPDPGRTPVIDSLAQNGVLFRNAYVNTVCSPSRAELLTGRRIKDLGIGKGIPVDLATFELSTAELTVADLVRSAGYMPFSVGKWHLSADAVSGPPHPLLMGFENCVNHRISPPGDPLAYWNYDKVIDGSLTQVTDKYAGRDKVDSALALMQSTERPWLMYFCFDLPHIPYHEPPASLHTYGNLPPVDESTYPLYHRAMTEALDTLIGRLLQQIPPAVLENTLIVFIGDNGTPKEATDAPFIGAHGKGTAYEGGINVPLIVSGPGVVEGAECEALVQGRDLMATVAELLGLAVPAGADSVSMFPYFRDPLLPSARQFADGGRFAPLGFLPTYGVEQWGARDELGAKLVLTFEQGVQVSEQFFNLNTDPFERQPIPIESLSPQEAQVHQALQDYLFNEVLP